MEPAFFGFALAAVALVALLVGIRYVPRMRVVWVIWAILLAESALVFFGLPAMLGAVIGVVVVVTVTFVWWWRGREAIRTWREAAREPLRLRSPFVDRWRVAAGGPYLGRNHHLVASDQRFAYDFIRVRGDSFDEPILAPCDGVVTAAVDGMPDFPPSRNPDRPGVAGRELGNYVAITSADVTVFLCHLRLGSLAVRVDEWIAAGTPVGRCGNSGRTTRAHLHLHAQDRPAYAPRTAHGVPVAFTDGVGAPRVLGFGDVLDGYPVSEPVPTASGL